jgi:dihydroorotase
MYDLLLKGGTVLDPSSKLDGRQDVAVQGDRIARIAPQIAETDAARTIDVTGKVVAPGLIDLHAHVFEAVNRMGVNPDLGGVYAGVTTIVDAGSAGAATFAAFPRHILPHCQTEVIPFLHICQTGLATMPDIIAESSINLDDTIKTVAQHRGLIRGIKARMGLRVDRAVVPFVTVKRGRVFTPDWGPRPWGWEPDRTLPAAAPIRGGCC